MKRFLIGILVLIASGLQAQQSIQVIDSTRFEVAGLLLPSEIEYLAKKNDPAVYRRFLSVYMVVDRQAVEQPVLGRYKIQGQRLHFASSSQPGSGISFEVQLTSRGQTIYRRFTAPILPELSPFAPQVEANYPSSKVIPENILLFYLEFNQPMNTDVYEHTEVKILDSLGQERKLVWRHKVAWNADHTVVALMLHPGRVKKDIRYLDEYGEIFYPGEQVSLTLGKAFQGLNGKWAECPYPIQYTIAHSDTVLPQVVAFQKGSVPPGSQQAVTVEFSEPMCYGSLLEGLKVTNQLGALIPGSFKTDSEERRWSFVPDRSWVPGNYQLVLPELTADLAQNQLDRPFESTDLERMKHRQETVLLRFRVE